MHVIDNLKFVKWFELAKKVVSEEPSLPAVLNNDEFIKYINNKVPLPLKISSSYINQILYYNPETSSLPLKTEEQFGEQFREWWFQIRIEQELSLYKKMNTNDRSWQRELEILSRRFGKKWQKQDNLKVDADANVKQNVNISFKQV